jgi:Protein kinase domain
VFAQGARTKIFLALEWVDGRMLDDVIRARGCREPRTLARWLGEAASALEAVHARGLIHRDVTPRNLMLRNDGSLVLMDFGVARGWRTPREVAEVDGVQGTLPYMAPEQLQARHADLEIGPASDVYGLCATFCEVATGERLLQHDRATPQAVRARKLAEEPWVWPSGSARLPWELEALLKGGLQRDPSLRPASMALVAADARRVLDGEQIRYRRPSLARRARLTWRRTRGVVTLGGLELVALLVVGASYAREVVREERSSERERQHAVEQRQTERARALAAKLVQTAAEQSRGWPRRRRPAPRPGTSLVSAEGPPGSLSTHRPCANQSAGALQARLQAAQGKFDSGPA